MSSIQRVEYYTKETNIYIKDTCSAIRANVHRLMLQAKAVVSGLGYVSGRSGFLTQEASVLWLRVAQGLVKGADRQQASLCLR